ncbi:hypothetical protein GGTG_06825 [Gaeumannomyces tritici R3-111a-1]|uniref:ABC transmembrane type-1 domain-containing protein n=1 Tax=Gaeumannomyces tritici (strain R3-111a-1) TaxID=644352 RepID=J3NZX8_GAET3|nr:hypothetical protein GGTG_06825 [Gaeumannomyces tritici R3-111a-1]EJT76911.1 hypothetical protein GGTG_06825 [Gaeumannomyces tritici R3-111a-1]
MRCRRNASYFPWLSVLITPYVLIPTQLGAVANGLLAGNGHPPYRELAVWLLLSVLGGKSGIGLALDLAKVPVRQFSERAVAKAAFTHVMALPMDFHAERDAAEVMKAVEQGGALMRVLERAATEVLPTVADQASPRGCCTRVSAPPLAAAIAAAFLVFLVLEAWTSTRWRIAPRRAMARAEREEARVMHGAIQGCAARRSAWPWRARCCVTRSCWCSTRPRAPSTRVPRRGSSAPSARSGAGARAPRSSSRIACPPSSAPTA